MVWILGPLLLIVQFGCWVSVWFGLPGNWFILVAAGLYAWLMPVSLSGEATALGWPALAGLTLLAVLGEFGEFAAGHSALAEPAAASEALHLPWWAPCWVG